MKNTRVVSYEYIVNLETVQDIKNMITDGVVIGGILANIVTRLINEFTPDSINDYFIGFIVNGEIYALPDYVDLITCLDNGNTVQLFIQDSINDQIICKFA